MAVRATGGFAALRYEPGNPQFPTLPDGVQVPHVTDFGAGNGRVKRSSQPLRAKKYSRAPNKDSQRFVGWQDLTTWINPALVDFGVIAVNVQRTVTLFNARPNTVDVTAISLPPNVTLVSPGLPLTLQPYAGAEFVLEASTQGDPSFDDEIRFTITGEDDSVARAIGQRIFTIEVTPQRPIVENLRFGSEQLRSTDATEASYSLTQSPNSLVRYRVIFDDDQERSQFRADLMSGVSELVVGAQKWFEARALTSDAAAVDTVLQVPTDYGSFVVDQPVAVYSTAGVSILGTIASFDGTSITLANALGTEALAGSLVMPVGLGYISKFPGIQTYPVNAESVDYQVVFNQQADNAFLDPSFPTLLTLPILEECNEISGKAQKGQFSRTEDVLDSKLSNRIAFSTFPLGELSQQFRITCESPAEIWKYRQFLEYLRGSYLEFFVPSFRNDVPGVSIATPDVTFDAQNTGLSQIAPNAPYEALRFLYPDGTIEYRQISTVVDNGATESITVLGSNLPAGDPVVSLLYRSRIVGDTATFVFERPDFARLTFRYRTVQT